MDIALNNLKVLFFDICKELIENLLRQARRFLTPGRCNTLTEYSLGILEKLNSMEKRKEIRSWTWKAKRGTVTNCQDNEALLKCCRLVSTNRLILHRIFDFLSFRDLKAVRLVCNDWEKVSQHMFENRAKVLISSYGRRRAGSFLEDFDQCVLNIKKYEFVSCHIGASHFVRILNSEIHRITSLTLVNVAIYEEGRELREFDLRLLIGEDLLQLNIDCSALKTKMIITQRNLASVQFLNLHTCKLVLASGVTKFTPDEVHFHNMTFSRSNGQEIFAYPLLWPFYVIEYDWLSVLEVTMFTQKFLLSVNWDELLGPNISLALTNFNFHQAPWIKNIVLSKLSLTGVTLGFDWSLLPENLETLVIDDVYPALPNPPPGFLPNLKEFHYICKFWNNPRNNPNFFSHFSTHMGLTKVKLQCDYSSVSRNSCSLNWIPPNVKELHLQQISVVWDDEDYQRQVDTLVLIEYPISDVFAILEKIKTDNLRCVILDSPGASIPMKILFRVRLWQLLRLPIKNISVEF